MTSVPFNQRFGLEQTQPIDKDFPESARTALAHLLDDLDNMGALSSRQSLFRELLRTGRFNAQQFDFDSNTPFVQYVLEILQNMEWLQVYILCERIFSNHLTEVEERIHNSWNVTMEIDQVKSYFAEELNTLIAEDNLAFTFTNGEFQRLGRVQTQKSFQRMGAVLINPDLDAVRRHYLKAQKFFDERPEPDVQNCVKEAVCALEACLEALTDKKVSGNFTKAVKQIDTMPPTIADGMIKLYAYRGDGEGITHAASGGSKVSEVEAELVLNLVASYVTYLVDLLSEPEEIPF